MRFFNRHRERVYIFNKYITIGDPLDRTSQLFVDMHTQFPNITHLTLHLPPHLK